MALMKAKFSTYALLTIIVIGLLGAYPPVESSSSTTSDIYEFGFVVNDDGLATVDINFTSSRRLGESWLIIPKFLEYINYTVNGKITSFRFESTEKMFNIDLYFYKVLEFSFRSDSVFQMHIKFNFSNAAMIIEPEGVFLSPQIGFEPKSKGRAYVLFPLSFKVNKAFIGGLYKPSYMNSNYVSFDEIPNSLVRLEVEFTVDRPPRMVDIKGGVFTFRTVTRYEKYAKDILALYKLVYGNLTSLFNVTLGNVNVEFFVPSLETLYSIGGYVPFNGGELGDIHINIFYTRYVKGYIEIIALHELVHHFLWKAGVDPQNLLWFHEGLAQYISISIALKIGYEGASFFKDDLESNIPNIGVGNLGYLQGWTPTRRTENLGKLYVASYYVVTRLAEPYHGLEYYARFFRIIHGIKVRDNDELAYYLSLAANETVVPRLRRWGFMVEDLYSYSSLILEAERALQRMSPLLQPYKVIAEIIYGWALKNAKAGQFNAASRYLLLTIVIVKLSPILSVLTFSALLFLLLLYCLKWKGVFMGD